MPLLHEVRSVDPAAIKSGSIRRRARFEPLVKMGNEVAAPLPGSQFPHDARREPGSGTPQLGQYPYPSITTSSC